MVLSTMTAPSITCCSYRDNHSISPRSGVVPSEGVVPRSVVPSGGDSSLQPSVVVAPVDCSSVVSIWEEVDCFEPETEGSDSSVPVPDERPGSAVSVPTPSVDCYELLAVDHYELLEVDC